MDPGPWRLDPTAIGIPVWLLAARFRPDRGLDAGGTLTELTRQGDLTEALLPSGSALGGLFSFSAALQQSFLDVLRFRWPLSLLYGTLIPAVILRTMGG